MSEELFTNEVDLDEVDLDDINLDDLDLSDFGEVNDTVNGPHIKVSTKMLKEFLKSAKKICSSGGKDIISKSTCLKFDPARAKVVAYATDFDVYVEQELECLNTENVMQDAIVVPTDILIKLMGAVPSTTCIYKAEDGSYQIRLFGGDMLLETSTVATEKFVYSDTVEHETTLVVEDLKAVLKDFSPIVSSAVNPAERRIVCETEGAFANYMFAVLKSAALTGAFDFKTKDIDVIKGLLSSVDDTEVEMLKTTEDVKTKRCVVKGSNFKYAFLISDAKFSETLKENMGDVLNDGGVYVDFVQLFKMVELASELPYATGKVSLNYDASGIILNILTKKGTPSTFSISGSMEGSTEALGKELVVQAKLLKILLRAFATKSSIKLSLSDKGLGVTADSYSAVVYAEA